MFGKGPAVGIDLGTVNSCVGVYHDGKVEIIRNSQGECMIPSMVSFTGKERLVGHAAKAEAARNPENTIFDMKRLIGLRFVDTAVQLERKLWPFKVIDRGSKPMVEVKYKSETKAYYPEEISAMVLEKLKLLSEAHFEKKVEHAVITVPAHFTNSQRQATKDAGVIAGFNVLRIINEPTAAAIAYGLAERANRERLVLVFDIGAATFAVSILSVEEGTFEVKATGGDVHFGGVDFDEALASHFAKEFEKQHNLCISDDNEAFRRLVVACERAKRVLTFEDSASIKLDAFHKGLPLKASITREQFESVTAHLFEKLLTSLKSTLKDARVDFIDIDDVLFVGGASRLPKIHQLMNDVCRKAVINKSVDPEQAVAHGAAIVAALLNGDPTLRANNMLLFDVNPHTLGIEVAGGLMSPLIKRNSTIPARRTAIFSTNIDNQKSVIIKVFEGEYSLTRDNHLLGRFEVIGIPPGPRGTPRIRVTFDVDSNGILSVVAHDLLSRTSENISIASDKASLSAEELEEKTKDAKQLREENNLRRLIVRSTLEEYASSIESAVSDDSSASNIPKETQTRARKISASTLQWLRSNTMAEQETLEEELKKLEETYNVVVTPSEKTSSDNVFP